MVRIRKLSSTSLLLLIFATPGFCGGFGFISGHVNANYEISRHYVSKFSTISAIRNKSSPLKNHRVWKNTIKQYKNYPVGFLYYPRYLNYSGKQFEKRENLTVNIINAGNGDRKEKSKKSNAKKYQPISPPHILNVNDMFSEKYKNHLKSTKSKYGIILIRGTKVSETRVPSSR